MRKQTQGLKVCFALLLAVTAIGILYHYISGYHYPVSPAFHFEMNVLGDIYELFIVVPAGIAALWLLKKGSPWGALLLTGVSTHFVYNYAMAVTGRQNLWIFVWIAKLVFAGLALILAWRLLPCGSGARCRQSKGIAGYLALVLLVFSKMMGERLVASATGQAVDMTMQGAGVLDWGEPFLRDPVVFFAFACPLMVAAIIGLWQGKDWGGKAAALISAFIVSIVTVVLVTGPAKEWMQTGAVSSAMLTMSFIMVAAAAPAIWAMRWLVGSDASRV